MSSTPIIEIENLSKNFKNFIAVNNLSLSVNQGEIFGFLGPNGAGKSTTIRMMLSLITPTSGTIKFFGKHFTQSDREVFRRIGALVERPDFYLYLSAYRNLHFFGSLAGADVSKENILRMLKLVGLEGREFSKVKTYSLGMKQRLGIAQSLIHNPDLVILDEPTNGLDPQGMKEIKDLLVDLARNEGKTIFLSSHILREVETMATSMAIINNGNTIVQGKTEDLLNTAEMKVAFEVLNPELMQNVIKNSNLAKFGVTEDSGKFIFTLKSNETSEIIKHLIENQVDIKSVVPMRSLENYFFQITGENNADVN